MWGFYLESSGVFFLTCEELREGLEDEAQETSFGHEGRGIDEQVGEVDQARRSVLAAGRQGRARGDKGKVQREGAIHPRRPIGQCLQAAGDADQGLESPETAAVRGRLCRGEHTHGRAPLVEKKLSQLGRTRVQCRMRLPVSLEASPRRLERPASPAIDRAIERQLGVLKHNHSQSEKVHHAGLDENARPQ